MELLWIAAVIRRKSVCVHSVTQPCLTATPWTASPPRLLCPGGLFPRQGPGMGCHFLLQGIFPTQGPNPHILCLLRWQVNALPLSHLVNLIIRFIHFSSVIQSCRTLCDPMNSSTPGLPVHLQLRVYPNPCPLSQWCHPTISSSVIPYSSCPQSFPASGSFQMSQLFPLGGQSIGVSSSASVLPRNTQAWSTLGWTGWISLQSQALSRVFSNTTVQKHQFFGAQLSL